MSVEGLFLMNFLKTVSTGPSSRSFPHVNDKSLDEITIMNSAEEISKYSDNNSHYRSPTLARRAGTELDESHPAKPAKKDKKWSLGGLFRRRKKEIETESSSEEETLPKRGFLLRRKQRKEDKRKKRANKSLGHFDHIVVTPVHQGNNYIVNGIRDHDDSGGILSDPTVGYPAYASINSSKRASSIDKVSSKESLNRRHDLNLSRASIGSGSLDSIGKKSRREKVKARVEAIRDRMKNDSSSDEESQRSTTSSITKFKSDDSLSRKDGTSSRKSRTARTERYNRRLTKEEEHVLNKEAELGKQRSLKSDSENQTRVQVNRWIVVDEVAKSPPIKPYVKPILNYSPSVPLPQKSYSGISTIPPSHSIIHRTTSNLSDNQRNYYNSSHKPTNMYPNMLRNNPGGDSFRNNKHYYHDNRHDIFKPEQRSFSYDCNINRSPTPTNDDRILHVQFPLGKPVPKQRNPNLINNYHNVSNQSLNKSTPPPPPPRDPQRRIIPNQYENSRPMSYAFENGNQHQQRPVPIHHPVNRTSSIQSYNMPNPNPNQQNLNRAHSFGWQSNYNYRSNSEDHIAQANQYNNQHLMTRPASATPDVPQQRFIRRHPTSDQYKYFAEKTPRSRKPIHIAATQPEQTYLSDSQVVTRSPSTRHPVQAASEFWRQKDAEEIRRKSQLMEGQKTKPKTEIAKRPEEKELKKNFSILSIPVKATTDSLSSLSTSDSSPLNSKQFFDQNNDPMMRPLSIVSERSEAQDTVDCARPAKNISPINYSRQSSASSNETDELEKKKRRSSNLEDALDELEAIYKSLRLGDEDLLDRAERRDVSAALTQKLLTKAPDSYNKWGVPPGAQSDSGFNYDCLDALRKKKSRRSCIPDKVNDDMAYRRLNKERPPPLDPSVAVSQVSYLLASPLLGSGSVDENDNEHTLNPTNEPDITLDDVVYRNIKHMNNTLKIADPQLPFGIPIGPITSAANSDYLHAVPENRTRSRFIPQKSPDIVKDDLAYRNLRKDQSGFAADDYINNNNTNTPKTEALKKRKAVRSITTNIYNAMHRDSMRATESENEFEKTQSLTDIADAMEIARQILKDRQNKIYRKSTVSDTESSKVLTSNLNRSNNQTSTETLTESKNNLLNELNKEMMQQKMYIDEPINQKPPICPTPDRKSSKPATKESTPIRISPAPEETPLDRNHLEDLLTALAKEAQETSEKLGNDLKLLEEESKKCSPKLSESNSPAFERAKSPVIKNVEDKMPSPKISQTCTPAEERAKSPIVIKSLDEKLSDIDAVSEHAKLCEKLLGAVVESTKLISHSSPAPSEAVLEEVDDMTEPKIFKSVANVIVTRKAELPTSPVPKPEELISEPEHDYENIHKSEDEVTCTSPFEENRNKLLADFQELKKDLFSDESEIKLDTFDDKHFDSKDSSSLNSEASAPQEDDDDSEKLQDSSCSEEGEVCSSVVCLASNPSECEQPNDILLSPPEAFIFTTTEFKNSDLDDLVLDGVVQNYLPILTNSARDDSEHSSGFHTESRGSSSADSSLNPIFDYKEIDVDFDVESTQGIAEIVHEIVDHVFESNFNDDILSSVVNESKIEDSVDETDFCSMKANEMHAPKPSTSSDDSNNKPSTSGSGNVTNVTSWEVARKNTSDSNDSNLDSQTVSWYRDPATIALACSVVHQLAMFDFVTLLGMILAIITVFAAIML